MRRPYCRSTHHCPVSAKNAFNSAVETGLDLLRGSVGNTELRGDFLQGTLLEHDSPIDALGLLRKRRLVYNYYTKRHFHV